MPEMSLSTSARLQASPITDGGTPVEQWTGWEHRFAPLEIADCPGLTVIAPHPDDETLGMGATVAMLRASGVDVQLVSVTDCGAAYSGLDARGRTALEGVRRTEVRRAAEVLGADDPIRLQLPDGAAARHEQQLTERIGDVDAATPPTRTSSIDFSSNHSAGCSWASAGSASPRKKSLLSGGRA